MKIGLLVHSNTGHTFSVAEKLRDKLSAGGHLVDLRRIEPVGGENTNEMDINRIQFNPAPDVSGYDYLIIGGPVRGFSISPVLKAYLSKIPSLKSQKIDLFVTQSFPFPWMGGKTTISQMTKLCEGKGAVINNTGIVNWSGSKAEKGTRQVVESLGNK